MKRQLGVLVVLGLLVVGVFGCQKKTQPVGQPIQIGTAFAMNYEAYGIAAVRGVRLALDELGGEIAGHKVEIIERDTQASPDVGASLIKNFADLKVPVVLGSDASDVSRAMLPGAREAGILLFSPISSSQDLHGQTMFVRSCPSDNAQATDAAAWIRSKGIQTVGVLYVDNTWGQGLRDAFKTAFAQLGGTVVEQSAKDDKVVEYRTQLASLRRAGAMAIYSPTYPNGAGLVVKQARAMGWGVPIYGADTWQDPKLVEVGGRAADGVYFITPGFNGDEHDSTGFLARFKAKYGTEPNFNAASAYDAMHILAKAVEAVLAAKQPLTGQNVHDALLKVRHEGVTGVTVFSPDGEAQGKVFIRKVVRAGQAVVAGASD